MAGSNKDKETRSWRERSAPTIDGISARVSRAVGSRGSSRGQTARVEQRSNVSAPGPSSRSPAAAKARPRAKPVAVTTKKIPAVRSNPPAPAPDPRDVRAIQWMHDKWKSLEPHHQQRVFSSALLCLSILLFASLTVLHNQPIFRAISKVFLDFFGWSAYLLALGLVAFATVHLIEGMRKQHYLRWSLVIGLVILWLLLLLESRLIIGPHVGILAELLVMPFLGWSPAIAHVITLGLMLITAILTFRITFGHILLFAQAVQRVFTDGSRISLTQRSPQPSRFLGQRPRYSRYAAGSLMDDVDSDQKGSRHVKRRSVADDDLEEGDDENNDPLNDINIHKREIGTVLRGSPRVPEPLDAEEHKRAIRGITQQELPLQESDQASKGDATKMLAKQPLEMEPLPPNPNLATQKKARSTKAAVVPTRESTWATPGTSILNTSDTAKLQVPGGDTGALAKVIQDTLRSFRVEAEVRPEDISIGPTIIRFGIRPTGKPEMRKDEKTGKMVPVVDASGHMIYETRTRVSRIMALQNDLALVLEAKTIRMEAPVPGRPYVGVEIPNKNSRLVTLREVLESKEYQAAKEKSKLAIGLGKDVAGLVRVGDLARMPHLLIAGATGAGKSVCINTIIASILTQATPDDVRLLMVDPKMVELNMYNGIPHLLSPVVIEVDKVVSLLKNAITEMERRYRLFSQLGVRNLDGYRKLRKQKFEEGDPSLNNLPAIVIIIDELADLMMAAPEEVEGMICRLAQLARATGIHLVVATQRPSVDVITGLIKANIPTRISFMVSSAVDSRTIIDMGGAERLLGRGDMLYLPADAGRPERIQGAFLSDEEANSLADYWRRQIIEHAITIGEEAAQVQAEPAVESGWELKDRPAEEFELDDDLLDRAEEIVREYGRASISLLQRRLRVGYSRAARLIDLLEQRGIIGQSESGGRGREVYDSGQGNGYPHRRSGGDGHSMADVVEDIVAEERARDEFLRKQAARFQQQPDQGASPPSI
ncbi:MAG TPA: DNA translocase FtsK [Ktedonobacteraceae bacterium]|nr:DNA translocase FtsK [Ktedonobacteraceae bacterium]